MQINDLRPARGSNMQRKRLGRGTGSGLGTTAGRGTKGQNARKSGQVRKGFEGGQMPLLRRIPKRGFNNEQFATVYEIVNLDDINERFEADETVNCATLKERGLVKGNKDGIKVLGDGDITKKLKFEIDKISKSAADKVEKSGGSVKINAVKVKFLPKRHKLV